MCFQDKEPRGIIPLENLSIREVDEPRKPVSINNPVMKKKPSILFYLFNALILSSFRTALNSTTQVIKVK